MSSNLDKNQLTQILSLYSELKLEKMYPTLSSEFDFEILAKFFTQISSINFKLKFWAFFSPIFTLLVMASGIQPPVYNGPGGTQRIFIQVPQGILRRSPEWFCPKTLLKKLYGAPKMGHVDEKYRFCRFWQLFTI